MSETERSEVSPPQGGWNEVAEIIGGEIEKNGRCSSETAWTLAGHLVLKLDIPGLKKKSNSNLDITAAVKVVPELSKFISRRGRGMGIVLKSSLVETEAVEDKIPEQIETIVQVPITVITDPALVAASVGKSVVRMNDSTEDFEPSRTPGSLLGNANDPGRPNLLVNFGDWVKPKTEEVKFDVLFLNNQKYEIARTNPVRGTVQATQLTDVIIHVFGGVECSDGQVKFLGKEFLLPEENVKMFSDALTYIFNAKHVID